MNGETPRDWSSPDWDKEERVHNWRNYVPQDVKDMWNTFTDDQKQAIARMADGWASMEDWD